MANKNKAKGTAAETRVVKFINGYKGLSAERLALHGSKDEGDIRVTTTMNREIRLEVKSGKQTQNPSRSDLMKWIEQTKVEGKNADCLAFLVVARYGKNPKDYDVYMVPDPQPYLWRQNLYLDEFCEALMK